MSQQTDNSFVTYTSGEILAAFRRVYLSGSKTVSYADAEHDGIGVTQDVAAVSGDPVPIKLEGASVGTMKMTAAGAFAVNDILYAADDGKVDDNPLGPPIGRALEAATADGDIVEVLPTTRVSEATGGTVEVTGGSGGISANDLVYVSDQTDNVLTVLKAQSTSSGHLADYICPNDIAEGAVGVALKDWVLTGVNTLAGSIGDPVYLSDDTAGAYDLTKPTGTDQIQVVGRIREDSATTGAILFDLGGPQQIVHTHADNSEGGGLTSPQITTGLNDANGLEWIKATATGSAVNEVTVANAATGTSPNIAATGDDANINLELTAKGTGCVAARSPVVEKMTQTAETATATLTIAELLTKVIDGTPTAAATYTLPTAADLVAGMGPDCAVGDSFEFIVNNKSAGANTITVAAGSGGTADGTLTVDQNVIRAFKVIVTSVTGSGEAYFVYGIG